MHARLAKPLLPFWSPKLPPKLKHTGGTNKTDWHVWQWGYHFTIKTNEYTVTSYTTNKGLYEQDMWNVNTRQKTNKADVNHGSDLALSEADIEFNHFKYYRVQYI